MPFDISTEWTWVENKSSLLRDTAAELTIKVGDSVLTQAYDMWSRTVTERARVSAYPLAEWFAASWWRLLHEPLPEANGRASLHWRMAHDLPAAGGGYSWPRVRMFSDGEAIQISARSGGQASWEPARYLTDMPSVRVPQSVFEGQISNFIQLVIERLLDTGANAGALRSIWSDIVEERADPDVRAWRELEARLGYDADEAPEALLNRFADLFHKVGRAASEEIAPIVGSEKSEQHLEQLLGFANRGGLEARFAQDIFLKDYAVRDEAPWLRGRKLAGLVRKLTNLDDGPVSNESICEILGTSIDKFENSAPTGSPISLGVRQGDKAHLRLHFRKRHISGRRFEAARFIADQLIAPEMDIWLPQTDTATARQQVQRSFAAEFLIPIENLLSHLDGSLANDAFDDAGEYFNVSPLAISSHLANNGYIPAEAASRF